MVEYKDFIGTFQCECAIYSDNDIWMFQKLDDIPATIFLTGRAKTDEVSSYFENYRNSSHKLVGWVEIKTWQMLLDENEKHYDRLFKSLWDESKCAVFQLPNKTKFYFLPQDFLYKSEEFKRTHNVWIKAVDDGDNDPPNKMPKFIFAILVKNQSTGENLLNPVQVKERVIETKSETTND